MSDSKVFVVEGDNNKDYSSHNNWFIAVGSSIKAVEEKIRREYSKYYTFGSEHPVEKASGNFSYEWQLYEKDEINWEPIGNHYVYQGHHVTIYIHIEEVI